jgi:hypothetical protein
MIPNVVREWAGGLLAVIRLFNGAAAMVAPGALLERLGLNPKTNPGGYYAFRMFGIRTVLIGLELMAWGPAVKERSLRLAPLIHLSDTLLAAYAGWRRQLPPRTAKMATIISAINFLLALIAQPPTRQMPRVSVEARSADGEARELPLAPDGTPRVTAEELLEMSQAERDALFRAGTTGAIPDGDAEGTVLLAADPLFAPRGVVQRMAAFVARRVAWSGKVFDAERGELVNKVSWLHVRAIRAKVYKAPSWFDGRAAIILDYSQTSLVARKIRDEIRLVGPGTYLGQVFWGRDRVLEFALSFPEQLAVGRLGWQPGVAARHEPADARPAPSLPRVAVG